MILALDGLDVAIGATAIIRGARLEVPAGTMCGLIGRNGAGKTTLMRAIMGILPAQGGTIRFEERDFTAAPSHARARAGIGYMPEDRKLVPGFTARDNIMLPLWAAGQGGSERLRWIYDLMPELELLSTRRASQLSGGQQKMVALARAMMAGTRLLLLDEPSEGLAPALARRIGEVLARLRGTGLSVLMAESNDTHMGDLFDAAFVIERGSVARRA
ncbi:MAG TPA: ATP-binding cassette domain-containing protein [Stellaceae bacterium]|nr:ATP-binding cassette domain-containing protein [Stellaceae bacterium]